LWHAEIAPNSVWPDHLPNGAARPPLPSRRLIPGRGGAPWVGRAAPATKLGRRMELSMAPDVRFSVDTVQETQQLFHRRSFNQCFKTDYPGGSHCVGCTASSSDRAILLHSVAGCTEWR